MSKSTTETEIKLRIDEHMQNIQKLLIDNSASSLGIVEQTDILWDYKEEGKSFGQFDQGFRLRTQKTKTNTKSELTFKGTPHIDPSGTKTRDEFNVNVDNPANLEKILESVGFEKAVEVKKKRYNYKLDNIDLSIDETKFGNFLELEGTKSDIDILMTKLDLKDYPVETRGYADIQIEWEKQNP